MPKKSRKEQAIKTKKEILETAIALMQEHGYEKVSIRHICDKLGISTGAFYHHFPSKEEMINQSFSIYDVALTQFLEEYSNDNPINAIHDILMHQTKFVIEHSANFTNKLYISQLSVQNRYAINHARKYYQTIYHYLEIANHNKLLRTNKSLDYLTDFLLKFVRGSIIDWCLHNYDYNLLSRLEDDLAFVFPSIFVNDTQV